MNHSKVQEELNIRKHRGNSLYNEWQDTQENMVQLVPVKTKVKACDGTILKHALLRHQTCVGVHMIRDLIFNSFAKSSSSLTYGINHNITQTTFISSYFSSLIVIFSVSAGQNISSASFQYSKSEQYQEDIVQSKTDVLCLCSTWTSFNRFTFL